MSIILKAPRVIGKYTLEMTCRYYPEQYDVYYGAHKVGYIRLRGGLLKVYAPDLDGEMLLSHEFTDGMKGLFSGGKERLEWLEKAVEAIDAARKKGK